MSRISSDTKLRIDRKNAHKGRMGNAKNVLLRNIENANRMKEWGIVRLPAATDVFSPTSHPLTGVYTKPGTQAREIESNCDTIINIAIGVRLGLDNSSHHRLLKEFDRLRKRIERRYSDIVNTTAFDRDVLPVIVEMLFVIYMAVKDVPDFNPRGVKRASDANEGFSSNIRIRKRQKVPRPGPWGLMRMVGGRVV